MEIRPERILMESFQILEEFLSSTMEICLESILMEFRSKSTEIGLESSWSISQMESLRNSIQYQWKLVWRALGQFPNGILEEFLSISMEIGLERILMEFLSNSMENHWKTCTATKAHTLFSRKRLKNLWKKQKKQRC